MSFSRFLKSLQESSEDHRRWVAFMLALSITMLITGVWVTTLPAQFNNDTQSATSRRASTDISPFESLQNDFESFFEMTGGYVGSFVDNISHLYDSSNESGVSEENMAESSALRDNTERTNFAETSQSEGTEKASSVSQTAENTAPELE